MIKFSIIVPVYNTEKYIENCLTSIVNQSFKNFEVIIVNDGSTDNSEKIIDEFCNKYNFLKKYNKENGGVSDARNYGVNHASGEYFIFIDSDDYIESELLSKLNETIEKKKYDLIKFGYDLIFEDKSICIHDHFVINKEYNGENFLTNIIGEKKAFDLLCIYAYKKSFWDKHKFSFPKGYYHEDFALIPKIILEAKNIYCIDYIGYHYIQINSSITRYNNYEKILKRVYDLIYHFDNLYKDINGNDNISVKTKKIFNSYISNALIMKIDDLNKNDKENYIKELKSRNVFDLIISDNLVRKIKKILLKLKYFKY